MCLADFGNRIYATTNSPKAVFGQNAPPAYCQVRWTYYCPKQAKDRLGTIPHSILQLIFLQGDEAIKGCHI